MSTQEEGFSGLKWNSAIDKMLADWCDEAKCFDWMNNEAYARYSIRATVMSIIVNIAIALNGVVSLVIGTPVNITSIPPSTVLGCVSIVISIISMLQDKFDWITMANNFKTCSKQWADVARKMQEQLVVPHEARKDCSTFLKFIKQDIAKASENNSSIPKDIRNKCFEKFSRIPNFNLPDICGQVEHTEVYSGSELKQPLVAEIKHEAI